MNLKKNLIALSTASIVAIAGAGVATADEAVQADDTQQQAVTIDDAATADTTEDVTEEVAEEAAEDVAVGDDAAEVADEAVEEGAEELVEDTEADASGSSSSSEETTADETESTDEGATAGSSEDSTEDEAPAGSSDEDFFKWDEETTGLEKFKDVAELLSIIGGVIATIVTLVALF